MVDQVAPAAARLPSGAQSIGPQSDAVVHVLGHIILQATRGRGRSHILCVAALDSTLLAVCWKAKPIYIKILDCLTTRAIKPYCISFWGQGCAPESVNNFTDGLNQTPLYSDAETSKQVTHISLQTQFRIIDHLVGIYLLLPNLVDISCIMCVY